jgi:hypothetical protein
MSTQPNSVLTPPRECPLHSAMRELAELATAQHIFYLEGECLPRPDLLRRLQTWSLLHQVVSSHLCPATRATLLPVEELESTLKTIRSQMRYPKTTDTSDALEETEELFQRRLSATLFACEACAHATYCPLHEDACGEGKESCAWDSTQRCQP